jgi:uncharacterized membrane protein YdbT with pleckstrin-like domain
LGVENKIKEILLKQTVFLIRLKMVNLSVFCLGGKNGQGFAYKVHDHKKGRFVYK